MTKPKFTKLDVKVIRIAGGKRLINMGDIKSEEHFDELLLSIADRIEQMLDD